MKEIIFTIGGVQFTARPLSIRGYFIAKDLIGALGAKEDSRGIESDAAVAATCKLISLALMRDDPAKTPLWVEENLRPNEYPAAYNGVVDLLFASGFTAKKEEGAEGQAPATGEAQQSNPGTP